MMKRTACKLFVCLILSLALALSSGCERIFDTLGELTEDGKDTTATSTDATNLPARTDAPLAGELLPTTGTFLFGESQADGNVQYLYDLLVEHILRTVPGDSIPLDTDKGISADDVRMAVSYFCMDHPEAFWFDGGFRYFTTDETVTSLGFTYLFEGEDLVAAREALDAKVDEILQTLPADADAYETALALHDAVATLVVYEQVGYHQTAYGALVDGKAVCAGYAAAYQLLLQRAGISAATVTGVSVDPGSQNTAEESVRHAWNIVWLDDNTCVYTDVTWDDQGDRIFHYYFNLTRDEIATDHEHDAFITLPECNHDQHSYFDHNNRLVIDSNTTAEEAAQLFERFGLGQWNAVLYYDDPLVSFESWMQGNLYQIYQALSTRQWGCSVRWGEIGNEYYVILESSK